MYSPMEPQIVLSRNTKSSTEEQRDAVGLLSIGTFLEYFDLMLYVHMAVLLNELFFPKTDPHTASLLAAFSFCSTYVFRPIGALVFGYIGDTFGRKATVIITTLFMSFSCIIIANLPTYAEIGISAAWIVTICRVVQGMSSMGEVTGAQLYCCETMKPPIKYSAVAMLSFFAATGASGAIGMASLVTAYGINWRLAFWVGALIAIVGSVARTKLRETPEFIDAKRRILNTFEKFNIDKEYFKKSLILKEKTNARTALAIFLMDCMWPLCFYFSYIYCSNILKTLGASSAQIIQHNFIVSIFQILKYAILIFLSHKIYPLFILKIKWLITFALFIIAPYWLSHLKTEFSLLVLQSAVIFFACDSAPSTAIFYKYIPVFKRFTAVTFLYALSRALTYVITSFSFVYLTKYFGYSGILVIMLPMFIGFFYSLRYFQNLEFHSGSIPNKNIIFNTRII